MLSEMLQWWNVIFLVPIVLAAVLLMLNAVTGFGDGDGGSHDHELPDTDVDADTDADGDGTSAALLGDALRTVGVGAVPISLLLQAFLLFFGVWGLCANRFLDVAAKPETRVLIALAVALVGGLATAGGTGALARRFFPTEGPPTGGKDLIARSGRAVYTIDEHGGTIQVRDAGGTLHQAAARTAPGAPPIEAGSAVILVARDQETGVFTVDESPFAE